MSLCIFPDGCIEEACISRFLGYVMLSDNICSECFHILIVKTEEHPARRFHWPPLPIDPISNITTTMETTTAPWNTRSVIDNTTSDRGFTLPLTTDVSIEKSTSSSFTALTW